MVDDWRVHGGGGDGSDGLGEPLHRKISYSHVMPRLNADFEKFFRQSSSREDGWLEVRTGSKDEWQRKWALFDDGTFTLSNGIENIGDDTMRISMDKVISIRMDESLGKNSIVLTTADYRLQIRAHSQDELNKWTFCFQKSVALVLSKLVSVRAAQSALSKSRDLKLNTIINHHSTSNKSGGNNHSGLLTTGGFSHQFSPEKDKSNDIKIWLSELGNGHGKHSMMLKKRTSFKEALLSNKDGSSTIMTSSEKSSTSSRNKDEYISNEIHGGDTIIKTPHTLKLSRYAGSFTSSKHHTSADVIKPSHASTVDLTQMYSRETGQVLSNNTRLSGLSQSYSTSSEYKFLSYPRAPYHVRQVSALSPTSVRGAIPINSTYASSTNVTNEQKLAASYNDKMISKNILEDEDVVLRMKQLSSTTSHPHGFLSQDDDDDYDNHDGDDDDEDINGILSDDQNDPLSSNFDSVMMFDLEDNSTHNDFKRTKSPSLQNSTSKSNMTPINTTTSTIAAGAGAGANINMNSNKSTNTSSSGSGINSNTKSKIDGPLFATAALDVMETKQLSSSRLRSLNDMTTNNSSTNNSSTTSDGPSHTLTLPPHPYYTSTTTTTTNSNNMNPYQISGSQPIPVPLSTMTTAEPIITWESGYCTILGPRSSNEDRLISLPDLYEDLKDENDITPFPVQQYTTISSSNSSGNSHLSNISSPRNPYQSHTITSVSGSYSNDLEISSSYNSRNHDYGIPIRRPPLQGYFAVYDGHCGDSASSYMQQKFHIEVAKHEAYWTNLTQAISETATRLDQEYVQLVHQKVLKNCGTTALGVYVRGNELVVYNIGDCHALLCRNNTVISLNIVHKPDREDERERIERANGWITTERELFMGRLHVMDITDPLIHRLASNINFVSIHRVNGDLAVTRSIGDADYKNIIPGEPCTNWFPWPDNHTQIFYADLVIPTPEFVVEKLTPMDEFIVLASDGLWDVINDRDVVEIIRNKLREGKSTSIIAEELCELAVRLGSSDNVSIIIVQFIHTASTPLPPSPAMILPPPSSSSTSSSYITASHTQMYMNSPSTITNTTNTNHYTKTLNSVHDVPYRQSSSYSGSTSHSYLQPSSSTTNTAASNYMTSYETNAIFTTSDRPFTAGLNSNTAASNYMTSYENNATFTTSDRPFTAGLNSNTTNNNNIYRQSSINNTTTTTTYPSISHASSYSSSNSSTDSSNRMRYRYYQPDISTTTGTTSQNINGSSSSNNNQYNTTNRRFQ